MERLKHSYHNHTYLCGHASGTPLDYVKKAIELNYLSVSISEHAFMPNLNNKNARLELKDYDLLMELYEEASIEAQLNNITFYKGFELEYFPFLDVYDKYLKDVDFLILGQHYIIKNNELKSTFGLSSLEDIKIYSKTVVEAINSGYFNLVAHPDLCFFNIKNPTEEMYQALLPIIKASVEKDVPLELNANGIRRAAYEDNCTGFDCLRYPRIKFLKMAKELNAKIIISSDSHNIDSFDDWAIEKAIELSKSLNLNVIETLNMNYYKGRKLWINKL